ncbi:PorP/SprF family type IX secretion system membrane protein [Marinilabilia sp.]
MDRKKFFILVVLFFLSGLSLRVLAQQAPALTQYMTNPLILNPAFAGNRNSIAVDLFSRQQWIGIEGAPSTYYAGIHAPLNQSRVSLGAELYSNNAGPLMYNSLSFDYAYLIRTSRRSFLSVGMRAGVDHFNLDLQNLEVIDYNDPEFANSIENEFRPSLGIGMVFFTQKWYLSASMPHYSFPEMPWSSNSATQFRSDQQINFTGGANFNLTQDLNLKFSGMHRMVQSGISTTDISVMARHSQGFKGGLTHRLNLATGLLLGMQINDEIGILYSFEFPVNTNPIVQRGSHELTLTFDFTRYIKPNRDRRFLHRKKKEDTEEQMNSIRYF